MNRKTTLDIAILISCITDGGKCGKNHRSIRGEICYKYDAKMRHTLHRLGNTRRGTDGFGNTITGLGETVENAVGEIGEAIGNAAEEIYSVVGTTVQDICGTVGDVMQEMGAIIGSLPSARLSGALVNHTENYYGYSTSVGIGVPGVEGHAKMSGTGPVTETFNIFDFLFGSDSKE